MAQFFEIQERDMSSSLMKLKIYFTSSSTYLPYIHPEIHNLQERVY